ncbi:MAG: hypothetical protein U0174_25900 [Polyangiaceae bacterium]
MRIRSSLFALTLVTLPLASACGADEEEVDVANLTDDELAKKSLTIIGNKNLVPAGDEGACAHCHDAASAPNMIHWRDAYLETMKYWGGNRTQEERINYLRKDPNNPASPFAPSKAGMMAAGVHLGTSAQVRKDKHPLAYEQGQRLANEIFKGQEAEYAKFRSDMLMPIESPYPRLTPGEYETLLTWVKKGLPKMDQYISSGGQPTSCTDDFGPLKAHASAVKTSNWQAQNRASNMPMFGCASPDAIECFKQQANGADVFPNSEATTYGKGWAQEGSTVRVLRALDYTTYYWMRASADGRFVANGGGPQGKAVIADLQAALTGGKRDINAEARYDPDFYPDNKSFMFQGTSVGGAICAQSMLLDMSVTNISFRENKCNTVGSEVKLYQTVGQKLSDNDISDHFIVNSKFDSDNHSGGEREDRTVSASAEASIEIHVMVARGNDAAAGYQRKQTVSLKTPYRGDTMMARTGDLLGSRISGPNGKQLGYSMDKLSWTTDASGYKFNLANAGKICMAGNKANISFDERFLTTHHYNAKSEYPNASYEGKGSADIYVADFVTGKKTKVTKMGPAQFALFPHFRSDGWLYFLVRDASVPGKVKEYIAASDVAIRAVKSVPTP